MMPSLLSSRTWQSLLVCALLLTGRSAAAQQAPPPEESFADEIEVSLVNLEVVVTDKKGKPLAGLAREDFEVYEDGKLVELTNFYAESVPAAGGTDSA